MDISKPLKVVRDAAHTAVMLPVYTAYAVVLSVPALAEQANTKLTNKIFG